MGRFEITGSRGVDTLWFEGDVELAHAPARVAVVGSRNASRDGLRRASKISTQLACAGVVVISGLALGIDAAAHRAAMWRTTRGRTIAVIGTPLDRCYPAEHRELQSQIAAHHLLVSPFELGHETERGDFVRRNRVMALLAHASIIVEAGERSGTRSHADEQCRLGRPVFVMRSLERTEVRWPREMVEAGDATALDHVDQVLAFLGITASSTGSTWS